MGCSIDCVQGWGCGMPKKFRLTRGALKPCFNILVEVDPSSLINKKGTNTVAWD